jgi:hypothetical protein
MPRVKHKKGPARRQAAWGPPSVAKRIGRDWKTMSTEDRKLLSDACRFFFRQHQNTVVKRQLERLSVSVDKPEDFS